MAKDPKSKIVGDRRRLLTIHDGARLTPAVVAVLDALVEITHQSLEANLDGEAFGRQEVRAKTGRWSLEDVDPILVTRSDGLAVYVSRDGVIA